MSETDHALQHPPDHQRPEDQPPYRNPSLPGDGTDEPVFYPSSWNDFLNWLSNMKHGHDSSLPGYNLHKYPHKPNKLAGSQGWGNFWQFWQDHKNEGRHPFQHEEDQYPPPNDHGSYYTSPDNSDVSDVPSSPHYDNAVDDATQHDTSPLSEEAGNSDDVANDNEEADVGALVTTIAAADGFADALLQPGNPRYHIISTQPDQGKDDHPGESLEKRHKIKAEGSGKSDKAVRNNDGHLDMASMTPAHTTTLAALYPQWKRDMGGMFSRRRQTQA